MGPLPEVAQVTTHDQRETQAVGMTIGKLAEPGDVFLLTGELGAGKTCLTQGIARGLDVKERAFSPSFVLVREYKGRLPLYHMDFYRLDRLQEISALGLDDYLFGKGVCAVEWADRGLSLMPPEHLLIHMRHIAGTDRCLRFTAKGNRYRQMLHKLISHAEQMHWNYPSTPPRK